MVDLLVMHKEELFWDMMVDGSFGCWNHNVVDLREVRKASSRVTTLTPGNWTLAHSGLR